MYLIVQILHMCRYVIAKYVLTETNAWTHVRVNQIQMYASAVSGTFRGHVYNVKLGGACVFSPIWINHVHMNTPFRLCDICIWVIMYVICIYDWLYDMHDCMLTWYMYMINYMPVWYMFFDWLCMWYVYMIGCMICTTVCLLGICIW